MRLRAVFFGIVVACGNSLPLDGDAGPDAEVDATANDVIVTNDAGTDNTVVDVVTPDVKQADAGDASVESGCAAADAGLFDASINVDAATAPWAVDVGVGQFFGLAADRNGNVLAGGWANTPYQEAFYLVELDATGATSWVKKVGSGASYPTHQARAVAFDALGNMYAAGITSDQIDLGGGPFGPGAFVVKYDANGNFQWQFGPFNSTTFFTNIRVLLDGNVVVGGTLTGSQNYGGGTLTSNGGTDVVLVEVSPCGQFVRAKNWGGAGDEQLAALDSSSANDIYIAGSYAVGIDFGGGTMSGPATNTGQYNNFIAKLTESFAYLHQTNTQSSSATTGVKGIAVDSSANVFVTGVNTDALNLGGGAMSVKGTDDVFVGKLDSSLAHVWSKDFGAASQIAYGFAITTDPLGSAIVSGRYNASSLNFGQGALPNAEGAFVAKFDTAGAAKASWGNGNTNGSHTYPYGVAYVAWPDVVVAGVYGGTVTFPSGQTSSANNSEDAFFARLQP